MAFTGIAATLLQKGKNVHKVLGLPVPLYSDSSSCIKVQSKEGLFLKNVDVFIYIYIYIYIYNIYIYIKHFANVNSKL